MTVAEKIGALYSPVFNAYNCYSAGDVKMLSKQYLIFYNMFKTTPIIFVKKNGIWFNVDFEKLFNDFINQVNKNKSAEYRITTGVFDAEKLTWHGKGKLPTDECQACFSGEEVNLKIILDEKTYTVKFEQIMPNGSVLRDNSKQGDNIIGRLLLSVENNVVEGFIISEISHGSIYEKAGLQNGDLIESIDGVKLVDVEQVVGILPTLPSKSKFVMKIRRNKQYREISVAL